MYKPTVFRECRLTGKLPRTRTDGYGQRRSPTVPNAIGRDSTPIEGCDRLLSGHHIYSGCSELTCSPLNSAAPQRSPPMTADRRARFAAFGLLALTA